jgi:hypothetical protein
VLVPVRSALAQPGQPVLQAQPGAIVAKFCGQAHHPHAAVSAGQPARQQIPASDNQSAQLVYLLMPGQPFGQLMQGWVARPGGPLAELIGVVIVGQPPGQPQLGYLIPGVGQRADDLDSFFGPDPVGQPAGELPPGVLVSVFRELAEFRGLVAFGELVGPPPPLRVLGGIGQQIVHRNNLAKEGPGER